MVFTLVRNEQNVAAPAVTEPAVRAGVVPIRLSSRPARQPLPPPAGEPGQRGQHLLPVLGQQHRLLGGQRRAR
jgi:hypothetical protein